MTGEENNIAYWEGIRKGNKQSLFDLYNNTYFHLVRFGLKITANDELVKDTVTQLFLRLWEKRQRLNAVTQVRAYLFTSLRRMLMDQLEYHAKIDTAVQRMAQQEVASELPYEEIIVRVQQDEELKRWLYHALQQLTPRQKELISLMFFEGYTYQQIATHTAQSVKTVYNTIYNAIRLLREMLK